MCLFISKPDLSPKYQPTEIHALYLLYIFTLMENLQLKLNMPQIKLFMICLSKAGPPALAGISANYIFSWYLSQLQILISSGLPINLAIIFESSLSSLSNNKSSNEYYQLDHKNRSRPTMSISTVMTLS